MNAFSAIDMGEVTRLTRAGQLTEAMALLQGRPATGTPKSATEQGATRTEGNAARPWPTIDMVAPSAAGGAWTGSPGQSPPRQRPSRARSAHYAPCSIKRRKTTRECHQPGERSLRRGDGHYSIAYGRGDLCGEGF